MSGKNFTTSFEVQQTPEEVFAAVTNPRAWWSEEIKGGTSNLNDEFLYHYKDVHISKMRLIEVVENRKVVWLVLHNKFNFISDSDEWNGNQIVFDITPNGDNTRLTFTQIGLVPAYECYEICNKAWTNYINTSLRSLITDGKGQPNEKESDFNDELLAEHKAAGKDFQMSFRINVSAEAAFAKINDVSGWWTSDLTGQSKKLGDEFSVQFGDVHYSKQKLIEFVPGKKVMWLVIESKLNFLIDKAEWTGTKISFELKEVAGETRVYFAHIGLNPEIECFKDCSAGWRIYITSLADFINKGKGAPAGS